MQRGFALTTVVLFSLAVSICAPNQVRAATCTVRARPVAFGNYSPFNTTPLNRTSRITVICNGKGRVNVALSTGQSGTYNPRYMSSTSTSDRLAYNLYTTAAQVIIFGDGTAGTQTVSKNFSNNRVNLRVYGQLPALENVASGIYADSIMATVTF
ncbi:MAG: spore coat protein U domain-containing protein [Gammaproteobacteria bacterium]|nr:spore coat protein U domain-containing protein [Gammaproteobacteria bacterium]